MHEIYGAIAPRYPATTKQTEPTARQIRHAIRKSADLLFNTKYAMFDSVVAAFCADGGMGLDSISILDGKTPIHMPNPDLPNIQYMFNKGGLQYVAASFRDMFKSHVSEVDKDNVGHVINDTMSFTLAVILRSIKETHRLQALAFRKRGAKPEPRGIYLKMRTIEASKFLQNCPWNCLPHVPGDIAFTLAYEGMTPSIWPALHFHELAQRPEYAKLRKNGGGDVDKLFSTATSEYPLVFWAEYGDMPPEKLEQSPRLNNFIIRRDRRYLEIYDFIKHNMLQYEKSSNTTA